MNEYQYYEFQAIDRPLGEADMAALSALSTRGRVTATSFTNHYDYGDFKGDPMRLMERWFDLHLYVADCGPHRLMIRLPKRGFDRSRLNRFLRGCDLAKVVEVGEYLILDIWDDGDEDEIDYADWDNGSGWLGALAPLRNALLSGDWRLPYLLWLVAVESGSVRDDELEPLAGIGPLTGGLQAFAEFFRMDLDLFQAAAEAPADTVDDGLPSDAVLAAVASIPEEEKAALLHRLAEGDLHVATEVRSRVQRIVSLSDGATRPRFRTVSDLRSRAAALREERRVAAAERRQAERMRQERAAERARRTHLDAIQQQGEAVWHEVEDEIGKSNANSYDRAAALLFDLKELSEENGTTARFFDRLDALQLRHERKKKFIERLSRLHGSRSELLFPDDRSTPGASSRT